MEGRKLVLRVLAHVSCEGGNCARVGGFQLGKRVEITFCGGIIKFFWGEWFEGTHCLNPTSEQKVTDRPPPKILHRFCKGRAYTNAGAELLVGGFEPRRNVDGVAVSGIVEEPATAEISDDRWSRMDSDTRYPQRDTLFLAAFAERLGIFVQCQCAGYGASGMVRLLSWRPEQNMQGISNDLGDRTIVRKYDIGHACEVVVEKRPKHSRFQRLYERSEALDVGKQRCDLAALPTEIDRVRIAGQPLGNIWRKVTRK